MRQEEDGKPAQWQPRWIWTCGCDGARRTSALLVPKGAWGHQDQAEGDPAARAGAGGSQDGAWGGEGWAAARQGRQGCSVRRRRETGPSGQGQGPCTPAGGEPLSLGGWCWCGTMGSPASGLIVRYGAEQKGWQPTPPGRTGASRQPWDPASTLPSPALRRPKSWVCRETEGACCNCSVVTPEVKKAALWELAVSGMGRVHTSKHPHPSGDTGQRKPVRGLLVPRTGLQAPHLPSLPCPPTSGLKRLNICEMFTNNYLPAVFFLSSSHPVKSTADLTALPSVFIKIASNPRNGQRIEAGLCFSLSCCLSWSGLRSWRGSCVDGRCWAAHRLGRLRDCVVTHCWLNRGEPADDRAGMAVLPGPPASGFI